MADMVFRKVSRDDAEEPKAAEHVVLHIGLSKHPQNPWVRPCAPFAHAKYQSMV